MDNSQLQEIQRLYTEYFESSEKVRAEHKPFDGLFGFGKRIGDDPCHYVFSDRLEEALNAAASENLSSRDVSSLLNYIYEEPSSHKEKLEYWMLVAVHKHTDILIPFLSKEDAAPIARRYAELYPKNRRLPVQVALIKHLFRQAGIREKKGLSGIFSKHKGA